MSAGALHSITNTRRPTGSLNVRQRPWQVSNYLTMPCLLLLGVWLGINSGPEAIAYYPTSFLEYAHYVRTLFPFMAILALPIMLKQSGKPVPLPDSLKYWLIYGLIGLAGCMVSPVPIDALYWIGCYFSVFAVVYGQMQRPDPLKSLEAMNRWGWVIASIFLSIMVYMAQDALGSAALENGSFYGAYGRMDTVAEMAMSRSSGLARFAAIPGTVAFVALWRSRILFRAIGLVIAGLCGWFIWQLQSRGAIFAFAGTIVICMLYLGMRTRILLISVVLAGLIFWAAQVIAPGTIADIGDYLLRGQDAEEFESMTGRTNVWTVGLEVATHSPIIGYGPQADRFIIGEHIHNTYMYALLTGGVPGLLSFTGGFVIAWGTIIRLARNRQFRQSPHFTSFIQTSALLVFFTIRSITEVSGAMFAVDLMIMVPAMAYLGILHQTVTAQQKLRSVGA